jgi:hypothetical protein
MQHTGIRTVIFAFAGLPNTLHRYPASLVLSLQPWSALFPRSSTLLTILGRAEPTVLRKHFAAPHMQPPSPARQRRPPAMLAGRRIHPFLRLAYTCRPTPSLAALAKAATLETKCCTFSDRIGSQMSCRTASRVFTSATGNPTSQMALRPPIGGARTIMAGRVKAGSTCVGTGTGMCNR